jgi:hypothetical protein
MSFDDVVHPLKALPHGRASLRTLFLSFEESTWETQVSDSHGTDIEVSATLRVDKKTGTVASSTLAMNRNRR